MARVRDGDQSRLLRKATGGLDHGGGRVLKPDSTGYQILDRFARRANGIEDGPMPTDAPGVDDSPFFEGVTMLSPERLARRATLSLAGRLPTDEELASLKQDGVGAIGPILDGLLREDAFYTRLKEGFNDIFLTLGIEDNAETLLSYEHFEKTRGWTEKFDLSHVPEAERQRARWKLADVYREALLREPLELIAYIVRNDRPFSELATADYIMVSPYTARGYGIFEEVKGQFKNPDDPFEYVPAKLKALKDRAGKVQESPTGLYPHAGFLSMFHYLRRYPTTETNRNRLRARMFYQHFLGVDIMSAGAEGHRRRRGLGEVQDPDDAGCRLRRLPQDDRSRRRALPGLRQGGASRPAQGRLVYRHVRAGLRGGEPARQASAGGPCNGSASAPRRTRASPSRWSSTSTTS